jgi:hypothetical protein
MKLIKLTYSILLFLLLASCGTYVYKSTTVKTPLLSERNDFNAQLNLGSAGGELYAAYAPIKYLGFSLAYAGNTKKNDSTVQNFTRKFRDYEYSLIPFFSHDNIRIEMPLGIGTTRSIDGSTNFSSSPYTRSFIQPTFGVKDDYIEFAIFCRFSKIDYTAKKWGEDTRYEPGFMFRGGSKTFKGMFQLRFDYGTNYSRTPAAGLALQEQVLYMPFHVSMGMSFDLNFSRQKSDEPLK